MKAPSENLLIGKICRLLASQYEVGYWNSTSDLKNNTLSVTGFIGDTKEKVQFTLTTLK